MKEKNRDELADFFLKKFASDDICCIPVIKPEIKVYLEELLYVFVNQKNRAAKEIIISILKVIFFHIFIYINPLETKGDFSEESRYITISQIVAECTTTGNNVTLESVAKKLKLSQKQTSRMIYKYYGCSLPAVITEEKLNYATYLLTTTDLSVADVAYKSNFHSENYFFHLFKKKFGCTPLKYRKQQLEK